MQWNGFEGLVYFDGVFGDQYSELPGNELWQFLKTQADHDNNELLQAKLQDSCRKLAMMWLAGDKVLATEADFYASTLKEAPALFGEEAVNLHYHLESMVLFARSALDIASGIFGELLPPPFQRKRFDSFNDLAKAITRGEERLLLALVFNILRSDSCSWLSIISDIEKGRSLRDKIVHQIGFPIKYMELNPNSDKESAVVILNHKEGLFLPLPQFVSTLREGVIQGFSVLESVCTQASPKLEKNFLHMDTLINTSHADENDPTPAEKDKQNYDGSTEEGMKDADRISPTTLEPVDEA